MMASFNSWCPVLLREELIARSGGKSSEISSPLYFTQSRNADAESFNWCGNGQPERLARDAAQP